MADIKREFFEKDCLGRDTHLYRMTNAQGASVTICSYGGAIRNLSVPDRAGRWTDVVLGYEHLDGYEQSGSYLGALVGRCCNRIAKGRFVLNGRDYQLDVNNGPNHLHGGVKGFSRRIWDVSEKDGKLILTLFSKHGEDQYPGNLEVEVVYTWDDDNCLTIQYLARSDQDTVCNLTNHAYFNLNGHQSGNLRGHQLQINSAHFLLLNENSIPTGEILQTQGTVFDFREFRSLLADVDSPDRQIQMANGYDHTFVLDKTPESFGLAAAAYSEQTGIRLTCKTTQPGLHLYTGNFLCKEAYAEKEGAAYNERSGFCFETQNFPDAVNHPQFPSPILRAGALYHHQTSFAFDLV